MWETAESAGLITANLMWYEHVHRNEVDSINVM